MSKVYFTLTGLNHYYGSDFIKEGTEVMLVKEPDNKYDSEAIMVVVDGLGKIGYVANSVGTVLGETYSAGRLYDHIGKKAKATVKIVTCRGAVCTVNKKSLK